MRFSRQRSWFTTRRYGRNHRQTRCGDSIQHVRLQRRLAKLYGSQIHLARLQQKTRGNHEEHEKRLHLLDENERQKRRRKRVVDLLELHVLSVPPSGFTSEQKHRHHGARRHQIHGQRLLQISIGFTPFRI